MFERYTEKARRTVFFSRYEASQYGSPLIETEHLLLGWLREEGRSRLGHLLQPTAIETFRKRIEAKALVSAPHSTSVDLPLSNDAKFILAYAAEEADRLNQKHIGNEHLLLAFLREERCLAAKLLREAGLDLLKLREQIANDRTLWTAPATAKPPLQRAPSLGDFVIHGTQRSGRQIRERVRECLGSFWHWQKQPWRNKDIVIHRASGRWSLDTGLTQAAPEFELVKGGLKRDFCTICRWELCETENPDHGVGYTNGRDWVCVECYEKFLQNPGFLMSPYPDIT